MSGQNDPRDPGAQIAALEAEIIRFRRQLDVRLGALAQELRRAEARDEWVRAQLRDMRKDVRRQNDMVEAIYLKAATGDRV